MVLNSLIHSCYLLMKKHVGYDSLSSSVVAFVSVIIYALHFYLSYEDDEILMLMQPQLKIGAMSSTSTHEISDSRFYFILSLQWFVIYKAISDVENY